MSTAQIAMRSAALFWFLCLGLGAVVLIYLFTRKRRLDCRACGHGNRAHARFCAYCGQRIG